MNIQRDNHRQHTDPDTGNKPPTKDIVLIRSTGLHNDSDQEHHNAHNGRKLSSESISQDTVDKHAEPSAELKNSGELVTNGVTNRKSMTTYAVRKPRMIGFAIEPGWTVSANEAMFRTWPNIP